MANKRLGRREFLKLTAAAAAAAGLSHFEFLNFGGSNVTLALQCEPDDPGASDTCDDFSVDHCIPESVGGGDPDLCPDPGTGPADMCPDDSPGDNGDYCIPGQEADVCVPGADPDQCAPAEDDPDVCIGDDAGDGDQCTPPADADICKAPGTGSEDVQCDSGPIQDACQSEDMDICHDSNGIPEQPDICVPFLSDPDACEPDTVEEPDLCVGNFDPDVCPDNGGDADICDPGVDPDECSPTWDPDQSDQPTPVTVTSLAAGPASKAWPALGGLLTIVGAAALWLRRNLGDTESYPD